MAEPIVERAPLPPTLGRYRPRWEDPPPGSADGTPARLRARDTVLGKDLDLSRITLGADRRAERDAMVASLRTRTTVLAPALVAVHDAGEWEDDVYVVVEPVEAGLPIGEAIEALQPSLAERLRWAVSLAEAARVLDRAGLALSAEDWAATSVDAYRVPRVRGLERAVPATDDTRRATVLALADLLALLSPVSATDLVDREARHSLDGIARLARLGRMSIEQIHERLAPLVGGPEAERPLLPNVDPESLRRREAGLLVAGLGLFVLSFVVLIVVLASSR